MNFKHLTAIAFVGIALAACATVGTVLPTVFTATGNDGPLVKVAGPTNYASDADGARMLDAVENQGELGQLVLNMPQTEAELNRMLASVAQHWPHPLPEQPKVKLTMIAQYSGATYADGTITLGLGTLAPIMPAVAGEQASAGAKVVGSDEELLYLIGHEFAHYALGHHNKSDFMSSVISGTGKVTKLYNQAAVLSELRYTERGGKGEITVQNEAGVAEKWGNSVGTFDLINSIASQALGPAWNRSQEDDADVLSLDLLKAEGIGGAFYEPMFSNLKAHETLTEQLQSTLQDSVADVQAQLLSPDSLAQMLDGNAQATGANIFDRARRSVLRQGQNILIGYIGQTHRPPSVRLQGVQKYEQNAYGVTLEQQEEALFFSEPSTVVIDRIVSSEEFKNAQKITLGYYESIAARGTGDYVTAEAKISSALRVPSFGQQAALFFEAGRVAEAAGNPTLAIQRFQQATLKTPLPEAYRRLTYVQIRSGLYSDAERTISSGIAKLNDESYFLPSKIRLAVAREQHDDAIMLLNTCRDDKNDDIVAACEAARAGVDFDTLTPEQKAAYAKDGRVGEDATNGIVDGISGLFGNKEQE